MLSPPSSSNYKGLLLVYTLLLISLVILPEPSLSATTERCHPNEKKVLLKIKKAFNSSTLNRLWLPNTDCCDWKSVFCESINDNHVTSLSILEGDFTGTIPDAIGDLPYLTSVTLRNLTSLSAPIIPFSITKLHKLTSLEISNCNLKGTIPGFLSKLNKLYYLNLSSNKLTGPIPSFLSDMPALGFIVLSMNRLTGTIPESLVKLKDNVNGLFLLLSHNKLSGKIPPSFGAINFKNIDLSYNNLHGDISMLFGPNKTTKYMNFARNKFEFNMTNLKLHSIAELDISHNKIYGSLPKEMINIEWESLNVSYNSLCGPIPQGGNLQTNFDYTSFFHNRCLCGAPLTVACK